MAMTHLLLPPPPLLLLLVSALTASLAQRIPENPCAQHFQYVQNGIGLPQGELTLPLLNGRNRIDVRFSQRGAHAQSVVGALLPYPDEATVRASLGAAKFRLSLQPDAFGVLPKLTRLAHNSVPLCLGREYAPPQSFFNRFFVLEANGRQLPLHRVTNPGIGQGDVEIRAVVIDGSDRSLSRVLSELVNEHGSISVGDWPPGLPAPIGNPTVVPNPSLLPAILPTPIANTPTVVPNPSLLPAILSPSSQPQPSPGLHLGPLTTTTTAPPGSPMCGQEGNSVPFIQKGDEFPRGRYPWLTALYHKASFALSFKCGGSLISTSIVLTAAHCVHQIKEDRVLLAMGRYDLDNYNEDGVELRNAMRIVVHPDFSARLQQQPDADIAVITLDRPVIFNDIIRPICLWEAADSDVAGVTGAVAGWGTDEQGNSMTRYPRVVDAKVATARECAQQWRVQKDLERTLCAGNLDGSGPCLGDSGGGLMIYRNNRWLLRGILSLGERNTVDVCNNKQYVLYCDLAKHLTWITQYLG